ncbi:unnamed protein product [Aphis gossypii]|uniref:Uncharacterized protein n=1 Tax=Aphis gossypii TaxID=80765 RepID=A0A9P0IV53_APHGO|nr:unnamed protein product [Aphis gossypii]
MFNAIATTGRTTTTTTTVSRTASNKLVESRQNGQCHRRRDVFARAAVAVSVSPLPSSLRTLSLPLRLLTPPRDQPLKIYPVAYPLLNARAPPRLNTTPHSKFRLSLLPRDRRVYIHHVKRGAFTADHKSLHNGCSLQILPIDINICV